MIEEPDIIKEMRLYEQSGYLGMHVDVPDYQYESNSSNEPIISRMASEKTINKLKNANHSIEDNEELYHILVDNLLEGILIIDERGIINFANPAIVHMLGFTSAKDLEGLEAFTFIDQKSYDQIIHDYECLKTKEDSYLNSYQVIKKDGSSIWIEGLGCKISYKNKPANIIFIRDISDRKKSWEELINLKKKYQEIADMSADGIISIDPLGKITYVNEAFMKMTNQKEEQLIDTLFREHLIEDYIYVTQQMLIKARKSKNRLEPVEMELIDDNNNIYPVEVSIAPLYEEKEFKGFVCTIQDISDRINFEKEATKSERLKTEFMNIAAHELKSPVTPIKGYLELILSDKEANDKIKKWAKISLRNSERLLILVNDILDVSRLDNDTMKFEMRKINGKELIDEIIEDFKPAIEEKKLTLKVNVPTSLPNILGDFHRLSQVLKNLFTNAIKFTDQGSITISAKQKDKKLIITVQDTGIGMNEFEAKKIFNKFYQSETSNSRKHEGTGLGLFICNEILKKHYGDITVESEKGKGSTFTVTLPIL